MDTRTPHLVAVLVSFGLAAASCSPPSPSPQAGGGIGGTGSVTTVASGPVTKFGSVFVSGTEYDNSHALYCIDDEPCTNTNTLKLGMIVRVTGTRTDASPPAQTATRVAEMITYEESVEGVVQSAAPDGLSLIVLGQIISVNQKTEIEPTLQGATPHELNPAAALGALVEVSGFVTGDGTILATFIQRHTGTPHYEIEGKIVNHNVSARTFEIGALLVHYDHADITRMPALPAGGTWNGLVAFARGDQWNQSGPGPFGAELTALRVKAQSLGTDNIEDAEIEDFITRVDGPGDFFIDNLRVQTGPATTFEGGTIADLVLGTHVEVIGAIVGGLLHADHITFESDVETQSNVAGLDVQSHTLMLSGLTGISVQITPETAIDGGGGLSRFEDLRIGDHLSIHGRLRGGSVIVASELERTDASTSVSLQSPVTALADPRLTLAGTTIDTSPIPESGFLNGAGVIGRSRFFIEVGIGMRVKVRGTLAGNSVTWRSVRIGD